MSRIPEPTLYLTASYLGGPRPTFRPVTYRPPALKAAALAAARGAQAPVAAPPAPVAPAGYVDAATFAAARHQPVEAVLLLAEYCPEDLPAHILVAGRPFFAASTLSGGAA